MPAKKKPSADGSSDKNPTPTKAQGKEPPLDVTQTTNHPSTVPKAGGKEGRGGGGPKVPLKMSFDVCSRDKVAAARLRHHLVFFYFTQRDTSITRRNHIL